MSGLTPEVQAFKDDGNKNFRVAEYLKAAAAYTKALKLAERDGSEPRELAPIYSNRSASFLKLSKVSQALADAEKCVELRPDWDKAYFRKAVALEASDDDDLALIEFEAALKVATEEQTGMIEQKIRLCKQRLARTKREEHHQPSKKQSHGGGASEGSKIREKGSGFKFAGAAVAAQNKMKMLVKEGGKVSETAAAPAVEEAAVAQAMAAADAKAKAEADAAAKAKAKAEADAAAKAEADAAAKSKADADAAAAAKADAEKEAAEKAAAEQAAAADKAAADEAAKKKAALVRKKAKAAAAAKPVPSKKAAPKKSPRPSSPKPEPTPTWLPVAVLGGIGAILFAVLAIGGGRSKLRA